ncbi:serine/threonine-protein kinase Nek4 isoform X2 [Monodelphis domestica]|uniref:serine/threonine-protein kinase Nek4 isoform X2 n=1 Tax=Monodelphis domestica TaxID=13616 RepID=UPI00044329FB|nr:serine/threonine-protein kinase Nek4 isoform X2 [Monodelphis domestica]
MPLAAYSFLQAVGKGSYGEVTLVRHRQDGKQYVIKKLNLRNASSRERKAAEQEAQLLSQLKHPNIVTYRESWEGEDGLLYIVMGFCEGGDLYRKLKEQKGKLLPENQVVEWFVQIAMALQYLHEKRILHRDLKTQNVFLTRTNIIKVGDLGIARVLENQYDMASTLIGTPYYMSPELFSNKPYNYKSDVWALGCCVYEMATLKHAFNAKDMNSLVYRIIEGKPPPVPKEYSPQLAELIRTMLNKKPEERPSVRSILRQPYIKRHIALFLEITKARTSKSHIKNCNPKARPVAEVISVKTESNNEKVIAQQYFSKHSKTRTEVEEKCFSQDKPMDACVSEIACLKSHSNKNDVHSPGDSLATVSKVDINILPATERRNSKSDNLLQDDKLKYSDISNEPEAKFNVSLVKEEGQQLSPKPENLVPSQTSIENTDEEKSTMKLVQPLHKDLKPVDQDSLDSTEKLLASFVPVVLDRIKPCLHPHSSVSEPLRSRQRRQKKRERVERSRENGQEVPPRPLPSPPIASKVVKKTTHSGATKHSTEVMVSVDSSRSSEITSSKDRPLSARERRRLKRSQEEIFPIANWLLTVFSGPSVRRASLDSGEGMNLHIENEHLTAHQLCSDIDTSQEKKLVCCLSEDELSSSASSTDKSDGDSKEGKGHTNEMNDLVQLMTRTLKMDSKENCENLPVLLPVSEFRLHRKYRDTLMLHGKVEEDSEELRFQELSPGSEKIRRMVEVLRADVIQELGVKLLEKVYDLMEEDDELKREVHLQEHLGEKYVNYSTKARLLKFFEENVNF